MLADIGHIGLEFTIGNGKFDFSRRTYVMGILNVTPDSFSDGGKYFSKEEAISHALQMVDDGADIIDIGGESTRPRGPYGDGALEVTAEEEMRRVIPVIESLSRESPVPISVDTYKSSVADAALGAGAVIVNDISGLRFDPAMSGVAAAHRATVVAMHIQGTPRTMQQHPSYADVVAEVKAYLSESVEQAHRSGVEQILIDPGIGFGKNLEHNLSLFRRLHEFTELGCPIVIGPSRKSFIGTLLDLPVDQRLEGTAAAVAVSIMNGANVVRVHDVREMKRIAVIVDAIKRAA